MLMTALNSADVLVIATEWEQFRALDLERIRDLMVSPVVVDLRNIYQPDEMHRRGFAYASIGRPIVAPALDDLDAFERSFPPDKVRSTALGVSGRHPEQLSD